MDETRKSPPTAIERLMGFRVRHDPALTGKNHVLAIVSAIVGIILGATIWILSPHFTGKIEPWDSKGLYYFGTLVAAGFIATLVYPRSIWRGAVGVYFGQVLYIYYLSNATGIAPMFSPFASVAMFGLFPPMLGAVSPHSAWRFWNSMNRERVNSG